MPWLYTCRALQTCACRHRVRRHACDMSTDRPVAKQQRPARRLALLTDSKLEMFRHKTAMGLLRYCPEDILCVIDPENAGKDVGELAGIGRGVPIVASVEAALALKPDYLVIGVATPGGYLPAEIRQEVYTAIKNRIGVISGLHEGLHTDPNIASLAARHAVDLIDLREVSEDEVHIGTGKARSTRAARILTVGTDCNLGKMTTALNLEMHLRQRNIRARFVATGQNGILIKGRGVCIDRVIADFTSGAVERLLLREEQNMDMLIVEGQGSILSPPFSGVSMGLLHGSCPDAMVLCHRHKREFHRNSDVAIPPLKEYVALYNAMLKPLHDGTVEAINLNTSGLTAEEAEAACKEAEDETGLPCVDVVGDSGGGVKRLSDTIIAACQKRNKPCAPDPEWQRVPESLSDMIGYREGR